MIKANDFVLIDFQDARLGTPLYDLASLLEDCYYQLPIDEKEKLKKEYYLRLEKFYNIQSYAHFEKIYSLMSLQRVFKAIGSFSYIFDYRKDYRYLKYIGFAMEKLRRILIDGDDPRFKELKFKLFSIYDKA